MNLSEETKQKIHEAHFVRGIPPNDYLVKYRNILELLKERVHIQPEDDYLVFYPDEGAKISLTYLEFADKVYRTANILRSKGIGVEDRIATVSDNHINTVIQYFAVWCLGATVIPINVNEEPDRIKYILESSGAKLAFVKQQYSAKIAETCHGMPLQIIVHSVSDKDSSGKEVFEELIENQSGDFNPDKGVNRETEALIVYTSGTTGLPKGVVLTQYNLMVDADGIAKWHKIEKGQTLMCVLPI